MKTTNAKWQKLMLAAALVPWATTAGLAADADSGTLAEGGWNRFNVSGRFLFNVSAEFAHLATPANPGPGVGVHGADHVYDNGYVRVDDSGNAGGMTWNWGFTSGAVGNTLQLQSVRSPADGLTQRRDADPQYGLEVSYGRVLKGISLGRDTQMLVGLQGAFGLTFLDIRNNSTISGATTGVQDNYDLSGLPMVPNAPYFGGTPVPGGPLPLLLPDAPSSRQPINLPATATERMRVEGNLYGFKIGPFFEVPLGKALSAQVQGGFAALLADGKFTFSEVISTGGTSAGSLSRSQWRYGGFVEGQLSVTLSKHWSGFVGAGWQSVGNYTLGVGSKAARVNLDNVVAAFAGLGYSF